MKILISIKHPQITLKLKDGRKTVDECSWQDKNDMSTRLLDQLDKILQKNKIKITELEKIDVKTDQSSFTSSRIAKATASVANDVLTVLYKRVE